MIRRARGQSFVELALVAPAVILVAMVVWDGGSVLREQVVLQQAARDGARVAAAGYGQSVPSSTVADAVTASAADLPGLPNTPGYLSISYPDPRTVQVRLTYPHALITPVVRQLWGGGTLVLSASATFYLPQLTPVPATIVASTATATPTPTLTPTATPTPTPTFTPTATPTVGTCNRDVTIPALGNNSGYFVTFQLSVSSTIGAAWSTTEDVGGKLWIYLYADNPFSGQTDPPPADFFPSQSELSSSSGDTDTGVGLTSPVEPPGTYTVYFFKRGAGLSNPSSGGLGYSGGC
jgi:TadE-like protein